MNSEAARDRHLIRQLNIIHLSDLHFGSDHRFNVPPTIDGDTQTRKDYPTLLDKLGEDLLEPKDISNLIICITGDFAHTADYKEFQGAEEFIRKMSDRPIHGSVRGLRSIYIVPGNHDVGFT